MAWRSRTKVAACLAVACAASALLAPQARAQQDERAVAAASNASGQDLFRQFAAKPGNIIFSPYSISTAMAMALSGARGDTEKEMLGALRHSLGREQIDAANGGIAAILNGYDKSAIVPECPPGTTLKGNRCECPPGSTGRCFASAATRPPSAKLLTANALMLTKYGDQVSKEYAALLKNRYNAEVFDNATLATINGWVSRKTEGKIDKILEQLDPRSAGVLLNAVYFKSRWAAPFLARVTRDESFSLSQTQRVRLPTMQQTGSFAVTARQGYRALRMPYEVANLAMVIVLPNEVDGLASVSARIDAKELSEVFTALRGPTKLVTLSLPRFKTEYQASLIPAFQQAGLKLAFDQERADFSGITGKPVPPVLLYISQIAHRALIEVTEDGTEAAAATAIEFAVTAAAPAQRPNPELFNVDRPFQFYIVEDTTGAILFAGRITDPRQATARR